MVKFFYEDATRPGRALQVWLILIGNAARREINTYGNIGELIGVPAIAVGQFLNPIYGFCEQNELPRLTTLVVRQNTGEPGDGYPGPRNTISADREQVYQYDWFGIFPPTLDQLGAAVSPE
jgi:hypothetical protein